MHRNKQSRWNGNRNVEDKLQFCFDVDGSRNSSYRASVFEDLRVVCRGASGRGAIGTRAAVLRRAELKAGALAADNLAGGVAILQYAGADSIDVCGAGRGLARRH